MSSLNDWSFSCGYCAGIDIAVVDVDIVVVEVVGQPEEDELDDGYRTLSPC